MGDDEACKVKRVAKPREGIAQQWHEPGLEAAAARQYWRRGPYPIWTTAPDPDRCDDNPHVAPGYASGPMPLYISYPAQRWPTRVGEAAIAQGRWPVIVFAHANHDRQCEIFDAYISLHDHWASWGAIVVSVDSTLHNCQPGSYNNLLWRKRDIERTLKALKTWNSNPDHWLYDRLDLSHVTLAGHSRGAGAALLGSLDAYDDITIRGVINLQGIDLTSFGFGQPRIKTPTLGVVASQDVDVNYPGVEGNEELLDAPSTWVTLMGAIHAYTADSSPLEFDDEPGITREQQRDMTELYTTAFMAHHMGLAHDRQGPPFAPVDNSAILFGFEGIHQIKAHISSKGAIARWNQRAPQTLLIDDFNVRGLHTTNKLRLPSRIEGQLDAPTVSTAYYPAKPFAQASAVTFKALALWLRLKAPSPSTSPGTGTWWTTINHQPEPNQRLVARIKGHADYGRGFDVLLKTPSGVQRLRGRDYIGPLPLTYRYTQLEVPLPTDELIEEVGFELRGDAHILIDDLRIEP